MLKKLLKQEWKSFSAAPTITMIILTAVTLILMGTFMTSFWDQDNIFVNLFASLTILAYIFSLAALSFCVMLCTAVRFYKNLFTDEGYLMFTLPVKTSDLLLSKALVAILWRLISDVFIILSIMGIATVGISYLSDTSIIQFFEEFSDIFRELFSSMQESLTVPIPLFFLWLLLIGIGSLVSGTLFIYTCICLGQFWSRHKIGGAIIAYFGLRFILRILRQIFSLPLSSLYSSYYNMEEITAGTWLLVMFVTLLILAGVCAALYCTCNYIMSRKLNLD